MDNLYIFVSVGVILIILMIQYDSQQRKRLKKVLKKTSTIEPLFMIQSAGQKLNALKNALAEYQKSNGGVRDEVVVKVTAKLEEIMLAYNEKKMTLSEYYDRLSNLYDALNKQHQKKRATLVV